jgi:hypothetical protein
VLVLLDVAERSLAESAARRAAIRADLFQLLTNLQEPAL